MPRSWPVLLWAPNVIGYVRIVLTFVGYHYAMHDWRLTVGTYVISQACTSPFCSAAGCGDNMSSASFLPAPPALVAWSHLSSITAALADAALTAAALAAASFTTARAPRTVASSPPIGRLARDSTLRMGSRRGCSASPPRLARCWTWCATLREASEQLVTPHRAR